MLILLAASFWHDILHPLGYCTGNAVQVSACRGYNFWSGIGSDIGEITLISAIGAMAYHVIRRHNCDTRGCWRVGVRCEPETGHFHCNKHHPLPAPEA